MHLVLRKQINNQLIQNLRYFISAKINDESKFVNGSSINVVSSTKYLGVVIDNKLNFKEHIQTLEKKIARSVGIQVK